MENHIQSHVLEEEDVLLSVLFRWETVFICSSFILIVVFEESTVRNKYVR